MLGVSGLHELQQRNGRAPAVVIEARSIGFGFGFLDDYLDYRKTILDAEKNADRISRFMPVLASTQRGRAVIDAVTDTAMADPDERGENIEEIQRAVRRYLRHHPDQRSRLALALSAAERRLGVRLLPGPPVAA